MQILFRKMGGWHRYHDVYEWSVNGKKWYGINGKNIVVIDGLKERAEIANRVLSGETLQLNACYVRSLKVLALSMTDEGILLPTELVEGLHEISKRTGKTVDELLWEAIRNFTDD